MNELTEGYLIKVTEDQITVPRSNHVKKGDVVEVTVNRVFVDTNMKKKLDRKGTIKIY